MKSPLKEYIENFDLQNIDKGYNDYWLIAMRQDFRVWNSLLLSELKYREPFRNMVFSIEGEQGTGKSAGLLGMGVLISDTFKKKFSLSHYHFFTEDLTNDLKKFNKRTFYGCDEQLRIHGLMSHMIDEDLANYEDIYRKPQVNIGYASPRLRIHEHFFIFEALDDIEEDTNGEPVSVKLLLKTKRKSDKLIMPRGIIKFKWPKKRLWNAYNKKKDRFIEKMRKKEGGLMEQIDKDANKIIKKYENKLYRELKDGTMVPVSKNAIMLYIYKAIGMRVYTVEGYKILMEQIKAKL